MNLIETKKKASSLIEMNYNGERFLTTTQIAEFYGTTDGSIKTNFSRNKNRFKEGRHFFKVSGEQLNDLRVTNSNLQISVKTRSVILWTERGALNHAKITDSDKAWDVFDTLVDCYFWRKKVNSKDAFEQRSIGVRERRFETDTIKSYVEYCVSQGMESSNASRYYGTLTRETYKKLSITGLSRDEMSHSQLMHLATAERLIGESLEGSILNAIPCRECYYIARDQVKAYADIIYHQHAITETVNESGLTKA